MSEAEQSGAGRREVAYRMFATEFEDSDFSFSESDEDRAPNYVITPTGARANRLFIVGVLTEVEAVSDDVLRGRVVDPTGAFVLYAGQYQPDEQAFLERAETPTYVAVTGKARTFSPEDSEQVFTSIRPESISEVDAETRDSWTVQAAKQTVERIGWMATGLALGLEGPELRRGLTARGADDGLAHGIQLAIEHYNPTPTYLDSLREIAIDTARVVAGRKEEIDQPELRPDAAGELTAEVLADRIPIETQDVESTPVATPDGEPTGEPVGSSETPAADEISTDAETNRAESGDSVAVETEPVETETTETPDETEPVTADPVGEPDDSVTEGESAGETETEATQTAPGTETDSDASKVEAADETTDESDDLGDFESDGLDGEEFELEDETREEIESEYGTEFQTGTEVDEPGEADIDTPEEIADEPPASGAEASESGTSDADEDATGGESDEPETGDATADKPAESADSADSEVSVDDSNEARDEDDPEDGDKNGAEDGDTNGSEATGEAEEPDDLQAAVVELMSDLDTGDGADKDDLIAEMNARYGTDRETVDDAIQDALMDGECYEPDDSSLKPI